MSLLVDFGKVLENLISEATEIKDNNTKNPSQKIVTIYFFLNENFKIFI